MDAQGVGLAQESQLPRPSQQRNEDTTGSSSDSNEEARPQYWCHSCQLQVLVNIAEQTGEVECLACGNSFVEEVEDDHPANYASVNAEQRNAQENVQRQQPGSQSQQGGVGALPGIIQQFISSLHQNTQDPIAVYLHGNSLPGLLSFGGGEIASNLGDYHFGSGAALDALLHQLMQADQNNRGTPPAAKEVIKSLPKKTITEMHVKENSECAVCKDLFELGNVCTSLPCEHMFCPSCIEPWLKEHNTCPICRHELPTDDPEYERIRKARNPERNTASTNIPMGDDVRSAQAATVQQGSSSASMSNVDNDEEEVKMDTREID